MKINLNKKYFNILFLLFLRFSGGFSGIFPSIIALFLLNRSQYGAAVAVIALATLVLGPLIQFLNQGYLRNLLANHALNEQYAAPNGTILVFSYVIFAVLIFLAIGTFQIISAQECIPIAITLFVLSFSKILETYFISLRLRNSTIVLFYLIPPFFQGLIIIGLNHFALFDAYKQTLIGFFVAQTISIIIAVKMQFDGLKIILMIKIPKRYEDWIGEFASPAVFLSNGLLLSAAEQIPTILFQYFGLSSAIPAFEVVKKIASVPAMMAHAFGLNFGPDLISSAQQHDTRVFIKILREYLIISILCGGAYLILIFFAFIFFDAAVPFLKTVDFKDYWPMIVGSMVTAIFSPFGLALIALRGDRWWLFGGAIGLAAMLAVDFADIITTIQVRIAFSILAQNLIMNIFVLVGVIHNFNNASQKVIFKNANVHALPPGIED